MYISAMKEDNTMEENKELYELREYIENKLLGLGFKPERNDWSLNSKSYHLKDELQRIKEEKYDYYYISGNNLYVTEVYRSNGTKANISYRIEIMEWNHSSGHALEVVKISYKDSKKKQERLLNEIINHYIEMVNSKENANG